MSCNRNRAHRPLRPGTPNDIFRHPLFFIAQYKGPLPLIVPEYFLNTDASFDGLTDPTTTSYYIFPYFAQRLFEYVKKPRDQRGISFTAYYVSREDAWFAPRGSVDMSQLIVPHQTQRRHWRWEEVLEMLWSQKSGQGPRPRWCKTASRDYHENPQIKAYLDGFAEVAEGWEAQPQTKPS
jgi:hypothetical protein